MKPYDVVVIGGGLTGLTAVYLLERAGLNVRLLEARPRLGGRILTVSTETGVGAFDLGPTWFWDGHTHMINLLQQFNIRHYEQFEQGASLFEATIKSHPQPFHPASPQPPSYRIVGGVQAVITHLSQRIEADTITLAEPVHQITSLKDGVAVTTNTTTYQTQHVIVTLPPYLAATTLTIVPTLPANLLAAMQATVTWMGQAMKAVLVYKTPFWRAKNLSGGGVSYVGPIQQFHDATPFDKAVGALFGWLGDHSYGRSLAPAQRRQAIIEQAVRFFGPEAETPLYYAELNWADEPFTTPTNGLPPASQAHPQYGHPLLQQSQLNGRLHWASTEVSPVNGGYLDGAIYIGQQVARRILHLTTT